MRKQHLAWLLLTVWLGILPATVRADDLADARKALQKGDLRAAQINLRNAVRSDPQNAEAHYWLGKVSSRAWRCGGCRTRGTGGERSRLRSASGGAAAGAVDAVAAEGKGPARRAATRRQGRRTRCVDPGGARLCADRTQEHGRGAGFLRACREDRAERGGAAAGQRAAAVGARRPRRCEGQDRPRDQRSAEIARGTAGEGRVIAHQGRRNRLACRARPDADRSAGQHAGVAGPRRTADRHRQARQGEGRSRRRC